MSVIVFLRGGGDAYAEQPSRQPRGTPCPLSSVCEAVVAEVITDACELIEDYNDGGCGPVSVQQARGKCLAANSEPNIGPPKSSTSGLVGTS